jgi:3',5'-cyclic AMP phosphodiesterase CpdA
VFRLAHLSDPHLGPLPRASARELAGKRLLGWINWQRGRARKHRPETLAALVADVARHAPDHVAVTGDLVNIALESEFAQAARWLSALGRTEDVSVVPGNHDAYVARTSGQSRTHWADYMTGDGLPAPSFPFVRRRNGVAIVGLSTAVPTAPFMATGKLGASQRSSLREMLTRLGQEGLVRVVLIHHPPVGRLDFHKRLTDVGAFRRLIAATGAELILHGHTHVGSIGHLPGPSGPIPVVGVTSASAGPTARHPASWNLIEIACENGKPRILLERRGLRHGSGLVDTLERTSLAG